MIQTRDAVRRRGSSRGLLGQHRVVGPGAGQGGGQPRLGGGVARLAQLRRAGLDGHAVGSVGVGLEAETEEDVPGAGREGGGEADVVEGGQVVRRVGDHRSSRGLAAGSWWLGRGRRPPVRDPIRAGSSRAGPKVSSPHGSHPGRRRHGAVDGVTLDFPLVVGGLLVGIIVGLTGMGGGALMTPMLVFFFGVDPLTAISSDIVVSLFMKPVGAFVHLRHGTVNLQLVAVAVPRVRAAGVRGRLADLAGPARRARRRDPQAGARRSRC